MNVILCGMMGAGKTTVGQQIAALSGCAWCDTDEWIVAKYGGDIAEIFATRGEAYFRQLEKEIVQDLAKKDRLIISTGGGLVVNEENCALLRKNGRIIFLRARLETLEKRLSADKNRPLLQTQETLRERLSGLLNERTPIYERVADGIVDVEDKTPQEIAKEIICITKMNEK